MAIKLNSADTVIVLSALQEYREMLLELPPHWQDEDLGHHVVDVERLIKNYKRSYAALIWWKK
jgi:hypothetical protein